MAGQKEVKVLIEVTVVPADNNESEFWDIGASDNLIAWEIAGKLLGSEEDGHKIEKIVAHECTLKSVRG